MSEPKDRKEYSQLYKQNTRIEGYGVDVVTIMACPFCAASNFVRFPITAALNDYSDQKKESTCSECGRSGKFAIERNDGGIAAEFVQTGGSDPAEWLKPWPRRA